MIFLDTSFLFALVSSKDEHHQRVVEVFKEFEGKRLSEVLLTTNHVIAETITLTRTLGHEQAVRLGNASTPSAWRASTGRHPRRSAGPSPTSKGTATRTTASWTA